MAAWLKHPVYRDLFVLQGVTQQMIVVLSAARGQNWDAWSFQRGRMDFTDDEVVLATRLQPMLITLNQLSDLAPTFSLVYDDHHGRSHLTLRELDVLQLLAADFTATAIGNVLRISTLTVRKHLEHIYEKLGTNDRLAAVLVGVRRGIIEDPTFAPQPAIGSGHRG